MYYFITHRCLAPILLTIAIFVLLARNALLTETCRYTPVHQAAICVALAKMRQVLICLTLMLLLKPLLGTAMQFVSFRQSKQVVFTGHREKIDRSKVPGPQACPFLESAGFSRAEFSQQWRFLQSGLLHSMPEPICHAA